MGRFARALLGGARRRIRRCLRVAARLHSDGRGVARKVLLRRRSSRCPPLSFLDPLNVVRYVSDLSPVDLRALGACAHSRGSVSTHWEWPSCSSAGRACAFPCDALELPVSNRSDHQNNRVSRGLRVHRSYALTHQQLETVFRGRCDKASLRPAARIEGGVQDGGRSDMCALPYSVAGRRINGIR